ncbi:hypothetical protein [Streptomyces sp. NPDC059649]|uniref:hypothetical protein n=1 Tax=Streptomyces sp. NPDC059649 TaxID=3346895 RepID=UPI00367C1575
MYGTGVRVGAAVLKHYYRLVYWKRRISRSLGWRRGMGPGALGPQRRRTRTGRGPRRGRQLLYGARPFLIFGALVALVVAASALVAGGYEDVGWAVMSGGVDGE